MSFLLDQLRKAHRLTTDIKQELYDKGNNVDRHELDNKIIAAQVYIQFVLQECELRHKLKKEFLFMCWISLSFICGIILAHWMK